PAEVTRPCQRRRSTPGKSSRPARSSPRSSRVITRRCWARASSPYASQRRCPRSMEPPVRRERDMSRIIASSIRFPEQYYSQGVLAATLRRWFLAMDLTFPDLDIIDQLFANSRIAGRYFGLPLTRFFDPPGPGEAMTRAAAEALE